MSPEAVLSPEAAARRLLHSLASPTRILVAISGGSDSTGLLLALSEALKAEPDPKISLCAATIDHDLRAGSADEARQVAALCTSLHIPHATRVWRGAKPKTGIMAAAREARYALLADAAAELRADLVVTAHTLDDQRETLAMRSTRSDSLTTGIADAVLFDRRIWIVRPLLSCLRTDIRAYLTARGATWLDDPSNENMKYERVRTRAALAGEGTVQDEPAAADARLALASQAMAWAGQYFKLPVEGLGHVARDGLSASGPVISYALGRLAAVFGGQPFPPGRTQIARVVGFVTAGVPGRMTVGRVVFDLRRDGLYLTREDRGMLPLVLAQGARGIWDGRVVIKNNSPFSLEIDTHSALDAGHRANGCLFPLPVSSALEFSGERELEGAKAAHLPKAALKRALAAQPYVRVAENLPADFHLDVSATPYFAPFDRFLTRFDFIFAGSLAAAFGTRPYPSPPLGLIDGKTN
ncbi:tRNA lysidine(34) synthetase TilS [Rhizobium sp. P32RR-XVIII]|uniref:tRNA lysidine(34) synthetase TilS n=1 Tax=Rhizobium sp. P32RR-XVIII TaxID=2726738 RepID=UPI00145675B3|nr:tRNA lysidine(34) synthetase TilS [Rhizobium sp. P32RR-XVIII]NLS05584.1 tRNA lysidine(34) synthetase TilS [Rhizobium sp. P32RR-XVIII]